MSAKVITTMAVVAAALILSMGGFYQVHETEMAIITQFGRPVGDPATEAGLRSKNPFVQVVTKLDNRLLEWDGDVNQVPTRDKAFIAVDTFALWRISDPLLFFQRVRDERGADTRLDDIIDGETRNRVSSHDLAEVVRGSSRKEISREILAQASERASDLGIEILDVRFKRINYIEAVRQDVSARMIAGNRQRALEIYQETLDFLRTDDVDDSGQQMHIDELLTRIEKVQRQLER